MNRDEAMKCAATGLTELEEALRAGKSEALERWLDLLSRFHNYSFRNCILISVQRPDATFVAGYRRWKELGRFVRKGEKGIAILAPLVYKKKRGEDNDHDDNCEVRGFKTVHVFDVSQTDGEELPEFAEATGSPGELLPKLEDVVRDHNIELVYDFPAGSALGTSSGGKITVRPDLGEAETFSVLCHELAHEMLHKGEARRKHGLSKTVRETEAEAVAFAVSKAFGVDSMSKSADYIGLYRGSVETLSESLDFIQKTAAHIIEALSLAETQVQEAA
jgi:antirestriction protein ArdC